MVWPKEWEGANLPTRSRIQAAGKADRASDEGRMPLFTNVSEKVPLSSGQMHFGWQNPAASLVLLAILP